MQRECLFQSLKENAYPGRGIVLGRTDTHAVMAYFIMGRSVNSRNRVFVEKDGGIITKAFDESKMVDPSLIIYAPVRVLGKTTVVTNGDQTDTVVSFLEKGETFEAALGTRTFEPDAPNFTPRISGMMTVESGAVQYKLSILKSAMGDEKSVQRFFYEYAAPRSFEGHFIHTYDGDGDPLPSFCGEPLPVKIEGDIQSFGNALWSALNEDNKVSLFVRYIDLSTGAQQTMLYNKNK